MFWFKKQQSSTLPEIRLIDTNVRESFGHVRRDTQLLFQWVQYLGNRQKNLEFQLKEGLSNLVTRDELRKMIDMHYQDLEEIQIRQKSYIKAEIEQIRHEIGIIRNSVQINQSINPEMEKRVAELNQRIEDLRNIQKIVPEQPKIEEKPVQRHQYLKEKIVKQISRNSKEYVKSLLLGMIRKYQKVSGYQLRVMIVEEQGLASKSSFYRMLEEIEKEGEDISVYWEGKEKMYLYKSSVPPHTEG